MDIPIQEKGGECMDIPIQDNCLNCIHRNVCYKSAWQKEPCKDKIEDNTIHQN